VAKKKSTRTLTKGEMLERKIKRAQRRQHIAIWSVADAQQKIEFLEDEKDAADHELGQLELKLDRFNKLSTKRIKKNKVTFIQVSNKYAN
jgi:hypothetical protein